ncbi:hypothetical protein CIPOMM044M_01225 [Citrobacter portucalensis]|uniref:NUMOD3 domain-containing DNA-binding protein n=1 Tax=Citrobacter portucalensis TaxID=1639133 RepID=UPI003B2499BF
MYKRTINNVTYKTRSDIRNAEIKAYAVYKTVFRISNVSYVYYGKKSYSEQPDMLYIGSGRLVREKLAEMKPTDVLFKVVLKTFTDEQEAYDFETACIKHARQQQANLLNISSGQAGGNVFKSMTEQQIKERNQKISDSMTGHVVSLETRRKISEAKTSSVQSEETKKKIGKANKGRVIGTRSAETIEKMKLAQQARRLREAA